MRKCHTFTDWWCVRERKFDDHIARHQHQNNDDRTSYLACLTGCASHLCSALVAAVATAAHFSSSCRFSWVNEKIAKANHSVYTSCSCKLTAACALSMHCSLYGTDSYLHPYNMLSFSLRHLHQAKDKWMNAWLHGCCPTLFQHFLLAW